MTQNGDVSDGHLKNDADLDPTGTEPESEQGEGYVDPIEADVEALSAPKPTTGPSALP